MLMPRRSVPELVIDTVGGPSWNLRERELGNFALIVFYRGLHCPLCADFLKELHQAIPELSSAGVDIVAISADTQEKAMASKEKWDLPELTIGYGLDLRVAHDWGLYLSAPKGKEPGNFCEPGLFLVKPDYTLYGAVIQSMPFTRPSVEFLVRTVNYVLENDYPARGELSLEQALE